MTTKTTQLDTDAEEVLTYLHKTERRVERTKQALREACHMADATRVNKALRQLMTAGYLTDTDGVYELTEAGLKTARVLQNRKSTQILTQIGRVEGGSVTVSGVQDILTTPLDYKSLFTTPPKQAEDEEDETSELLDRTLHTSECGVPNYSFHPLRISAAIMQQPGSTQRKQAVVLRYLLAFEHPQDALPVPILHGDVLGRSKNANVWLKSDDYISSRHCRFEIRTESGKFNLYVEDLGSKNGTFVDNEQLEEGKAVRVRHGSKIQVGSTVLIVMQIPY